MKVVMLFPGYGGQFVGMGKELYDNSRTMQEYFEEASNCLNINFVKLCFASSDAEISKISNALLANFLVSSSLYRLLKEQGVIPHLVLGHDAGVYAAIYAAGGISFPDMLYLLQKYTTAYQELLNTVPTKAVRVTGLATDIVTRLSKPYENGNGNAFVAIYESDTESIVAGHSIAVEQLVEDLRHAGAKKIVELPLIAGLHSPLMKGVEDTVRRYSEKVDFKDLSIPLLTPTTAQVIASRQEVRDEMFNQIVSPVRWSDCVKTIADYDVIIEIGPGTRLSDKLKKVYPNTIIRAVNKEADITALKELVSTNKNG